MNNARDVSVAKTTVTYNLQEFDASDEAIENIKKYNVVDWENGGYIPTAIAYENGDGETTSPTLNPDGEW